MSEYRTRSDKRSKKKTNTILNIMIGVVALLILIVGATIFLNSGEDKSTVSNEVANEKSNEDASQSEENSDNNENKEENENDSINMNEKEESNSSSSKTNNENEKVDADTEEDKDEVAINTEDKSDLIVEDGNEPNVKKSIVHPDWKPIGTTQTGEHVSKYDGNSIDWKEKVKALSYATGIPVEDMTVWYIEGNGSPQKSIGTVSKKDGSVYYRVYLQWIDGQGWKPTKMQELIENDKN